MNSAADAILNPAVGWLVLAGFSALWIFLGWFWGRNSRALDDCVLAGRRVGLALGTATAMATWVTSNTTMAAPQLALLSWAIEDGQLAAIAAADWRLWASIAFQALLVTIFGYAVWYQMMRRFSVNQVMPFTLLVPLFGVLSGVVFFDDRLTWLMILGGACTILGVAIITIRRPRVIAPSTKAGL